MRRWRLVAWHAVLAVGACLNAAPARADEQQDPEAAIRRGVELRKRGEDEQALREFRAAYEATPSPRALAQIGLAEQALGRWAEAEVHVRDALTSATDAWIQKNRPSLDGALETIAKHVGSLEVLGEPKGAEVRVQAKTVGHLPLDKPIRVAAGDVVVEVLHPGFRAISRTVNVAAAALSRETFVLVASVAADASTPPSGGSGRLPLVAAGSAGDDSAPPSTSWQRTAKWIAGGLAVVGLGIGVAETIVAVNKSNDFNALPENCMDGGNGQIVGGPRCEQVDRDQTAATWRAGFGYGFGGAMAIAAVVLHLSEPRAASRKETAWLTCGPSLATNGLGCAGRW